MSTTELAPRAQIMPLDVAQTRAAMTMHQQQLAQIVADTDWQVFRDRGGAERKFLKRSGWRKIAFWYALDLQVVRMDLDRDEQGVVIRAHVIARAQHPNGRFADGDGGCSARERGFAKPEHDIAAVAVTRATNRAISNLVGMGDVSAEEVDGTAEVATAAPITMLDADGEQQLVDALRLKWPELEPDRFLVLLRKRFEGSVPEAAGLALRAWQWWAADPPQPRAETPQTAAGEPVAPSTPVSGEVVS